MTPIVEAKNVSLTLGGRPILEDVTFTLEEGGFLGIIGPNGGGKTMLLRCITGLTKPTSGELRICGVSPEAARGQIGYVPQFGRFDRDFPIRVIDVVLMGRLAHVPPFRSFTKADATKAQEKLQKVGLDGYGLRPVAALSGGELQRVLIARALATEPKLLLLDEPTASLDTNVGRSFYELLDELSKEMTIILVSHDLGVVARYVRAIGCLNRKLHYHNSPELSHEALAEVYGCPIDLIAHGHAHRVLEDHGGKRG